MTTEGYNVQRKIAIARRAQAEIEERNPDYIEERGADAAKYYQLDLDLIELGALVERM